MEKGLIGALKRRVTRFREEADLMEKLLIETTNDYEEILAERGQLRAALAARETEVGRLRSLLEDTSYIDRDWDKNNPPDGYEFYYSDWVEWRIKTHIALADPTA